MVLCSRAKVPVKQRDVPLGIKKYLGRLSSSGPVEPFFIVLGISFSLSVSAACCFRMYQLSTI